MSTQDDSSISRLPDAAVVASWSSQERDQVARLLAEASSPPVPPRRHTPRPLVLLIGSGGALVLLPWIAYLTATLPLTAHVGAWRVAWVGYDVGLVAALATVGHLARHRRQLVTIALTVAATLLTVDAWFDVTLSWGTADQATSFVTAALVELPVAALLIGVALMMLRMMVATTAALRGDHPGRFSLWRAPVIMHGSPTS